MTGISELGTIGIWSGSRGGLRSPDPSKRAEIDEAVAEIEELGFGALWIGGQPRVVDTAPLLAATSRIPVITAIVSIWVDPPAEVAAQYAAVNAAHRDRLLLGLGVSHDALAPNYQKPYTAMARTLDGLDAAAEPVPASRRLLAALGPKMLDLARDRAAGAHPYMLTPERTAEIRQLLGEGPLLAPEVKVVLEPGRDAALAAARSHIGPYLGMPNYTNSLRRMGFGDEDFAAGGSERLLDAVFAIGDLEHVRKRAGEFLAAGADHLAIQVVTAEHGINPRAEWRALADALL